MRSIKSVGLILLIPALLAAEAAFSGQVDIIYEPGQKLRTIWVPPLDTKIIQFPGDLSSCLNKASVISLATADAFKVGDDQWVREIAVSLNLSKLNEDNVKAAENTEYTIKCKFLGAAGEYLWVRFPVRIDSYSKHSSEENYLVSVPGRRLAGPKFQERIKSYSGFQIKGEKLILPEISASIEDKSPAASPKDAEFKETIKGYSTLKPQKKED